jgi:hypothetical protein
LIGKIPGIKRLTRLHAGTVTDSREQQIQLEVGRLPWGKRMIWRDSVKMKEPMNRYSLGAVVTGVLPCQINELRLNRQRRLV